MKYSSAALKLLILKEYGKLTNSKFYNSYTTIESLENSFTESVAALEAKYSAILSRIEAGGADGFLCFYDPEFPKLPATVKKSALPCLLFYRGDISLLKYERNIAIIGLTDIDENISVRERKIVEHLVADKAVIVSGLARGCDTCAHETCIDNGGKTIAVLPTPLNEIYPAENQGLANRIVENGGLLVTEYCSPPSSKYESIGRFPQRDGLQALFSKAVVLIASYKKGEGDSGSIYAMEMAKACGMGRYAMQPSVSDKNNPKFGLNSEYLDTRFAEKMPDNTTIKELIANETYDIDKSEQLCMFS